MDKQQAAKEFAEKESRTGGDPLFYEIGYLAGWEACAAQSSNDAVAFLEWGHENYEYLIAGAGEIRWRKKGIERPKGDNGKLYTTAELYKLFNPSGAAPQADVDEKCEHCDGDGIIRTIAPLDDGTHEMHCPYCKARNDAMEESSPKAAPLTAGPVWVSVKDGLPQTKHGYVIDVLATNGIKWERVTFFTETKEWRKWTKLLEWTPTHWIYINLPNDESPAAQQVYTREQVEKALRDGAAFGVFCHHPEMLEERCNEYMNANFPPPINK
jgi:hypothetical protein